MCHLADSYIEGYLPNWLMDIHAGHNYGVLDTEVIKKIKTLRGI